MIGHIDFDFDGYSYMQDITGDSQADIRAELEIWLENEIDMDVETQRTDTDIFSVTAVNDSGSICGNGIITMGDKQ